MSPTRTTSGEGCANNKKLTAGTGPSTATCQPVLSKLPIPAFSQRATRFAEREDFPSASLACHPVVKPSRRVMTDARNTGAHHQAHMEVVSEREARDMVQAMIASLR